MVHSEKNMYPEYIKTLTTQQYNKHYNPNKNGQKIYTKAGEMDSK